MTENLKHWIKGFLVSFIIFAVLLLYLYLRRGYVNIYILNKAFASAAAVAGGFTLLIGPISHRFHHLNRFMTIRREIGIFAFVFAIIHISFSLLQQNRFPLFDWYLKELTPVIAGIWAIIVWTYMAYLSRNSKIKELGADIWKENLSLVGKISFLAIFLHLTIMKYPGWIRWFNGQTKQTPDLANPNFPPASVFVFIIMFAILIFRILNYIFKKSSNNLQINN